MSGSDDRSTDRRSVLPLEGFHEADGSPAKEYAGDTSTCLVTGSAMLLALVCGLLAGAVLPEGGGAIFAISLVSGAWIATLQSLMVPLAFASAAARAAKAAVAARHATRVAGRLPLAFAGLLLGSVLIAPIVVPTARAGHGSPPGWPI